MNDIEILIAFFVVVGGSVTAAGFLWIRRNGGMVTATETAPATTLQESLKQFGAIVPKRSQHAEHYRILLRNAGYRHPDALTTFFGIKAATILAFGCIFAMASMIATGESAGLFLAVVSGAGLGHLLPDRIVRTIHTRREQRIRVGLPMALEMMILGLEAGQSLDATIGETARELGPAHAELAEEFNLVLVEMIAGKSRQEALREMIDRNTEPEIKRVAQVLVDGDRFGTSLAAALRNQLRYLRTRMRQSAQEQARKISVKMVFPIFFLIFPAIMLVTLGPAVIQIYQALGRMMAD